MHACMPHKLISATSHIVHFLSPLSSSSSSMAATMRRPDALSLLFLLLLSVSITCIPPVASICVPRNSSSQPITSPAQASGEDHKAAASPSPKPSSNSPAAAPSIADAIDELCSHTDYKDLCISSTRSLLPETGTIDAKSFLQLEMKAVRTGAELAKSKVNERASAPGADATTGAYLRNCAEQYDDACGNLDDAEKALAARDKATLAVQLSAALDSFATCEDGFAEAALESPVEAEDEELQHLASNCLALAEVAVK